MPERRVVVLYRHRLFGEAIARVLRDDGRIHVNLIEADSISAGALDAMRPDAIVLERCRQSDGPAAGCVGACPLLTFVVDPESNVAEVYERRELIPATPDEIIARIVRQAGTPRLRRKGCGARWWGS